MRVSKPSWVRHGSIRSNTPITSIDFEPISGNKFATSGTGAYHNYVITGAVYHRCLRDSDGVVRVWSTGPVCDPSLEAAGFDAAPRLLGHLKCECGQLNVVRWSPTGQLIATGAENGLVLLWRQSQGASVFVGNLGEDKDVKPERDMNKPTETWSMRSTLRGHTIDLPVNDVAWSPCGTKLATVGSDSNLLVWDCEEAALGPVVTTKGSLVTRPLIDLKGAHSAYIRGVSWDPVGKYIATFGDDKTVKVWIVDKEYKFARVFALITEPYTQLQHRGPTAHMDWSPDGRFLSTTNGFLPPRMTAPVLARKDWSVAASFVGHSLVVGAARFNPTLFRSSNAVASSSAVDAVCAIGSTDQSISVWVTTSPKPVVVLSESFGLAVSDLAWHPNGCLLLACSLDGSITAVEFTGDELGRRLKPDERVAYLKSLYPEFPAVKTSRTSNDDSTTAEPAAMRVEATSINVAKTQVVTQTSSGKKRIQPVLLAGGEATPLPKSLETVQDTAAEPSLPKKARISLEAVGPASHVNAALHARLAGDIETSLAASPPLPSVSRVQATSVPTSFALLSPRGPPSSCQLMGTTRFSSALPTAVPADVRVSFQSQHGGTLVTGPEWTHFCPQPVSCAAGQDDVLVIGCVDGSVHVLTFGGSALCPAFVIEGAVIEIAIQPCDDHVTVAVANSSGDVAMYSVTSVDAVSFVKSLSLKAPMQSMIRQLAGPVKDVVASCCLTSMQLRAGASPVVTVTLSVTVSGKLCPQAFAYSDALCAWVRVADGLYSASRYSMSLGTGPLATLQKTTQIGGPFGAGTTSSHAVSLSHCEARMMSAQVLQSLDDFMHWLNLYVDQCVQHEEVTRLRALCNALQAKGSNPIIANSSGSSAELLKSVCSKLAESHHDSVQKIAGEY